MPSSAASETSVFSNATEAESEITEGGEFFLEEGSMTPRQTYFMCYATDLLSAYDQIKKRSLTGVKAVDDVSIISTCAAAMYRLSTFLQEGFAALRCVVCCASR